MTVAGGVVVLLFTDVEASTRLWETERALMSQALARHDDLLRTAIEGSGGVVFKTVGDAFCATFADVADSVRAALAIQRSMVNERWPTANPMRVRIGIHAGVCELRHGDYFGPPVNRTARLLATAHGGQTVVSAVTADLVGDQLPEGAWLDDLGEHRLKDLSRPEHVFQLNCDGLPTEFASLRSLDNPRLRHNLPAQLSTFIGRDRELQELRGRVQTARVLTLAGTGGVGKTRLALQAAAEQLDGSGDGVWFVELAALADPALVPTAIANVLEVRMELGKDPLDTLATALCDRRMLIVLDNCEHVVDEAARVAETLAQRCPGVAILATSREPLGIAGESVYRVPSLSLPDADEQDLARLAGSAAVTMFIDRAAQHTTRLVVDAETARHVARVCRRLDGIPLAIELAAARLGSLSVAELETRLDARFRLLTTGSRTALPRHRTLEALIEWSYGLLSDLERLLLDRLAVFAGGFDMDAAESVCTDAALERAAVFDVLDALVNKSLVQREESDSGGRFRLLETVRAYAAENLARGGAEAVEMVRGAHLQYFLALTERADRELIGPEQAHWLKRLDAEHDNVRIALAESLDVSEPLVGLRLAAAIADFRGVRGNAVEGLEALREQLSRPAAISRTAERGRALAAAALLARAVGDYPGAIVHGEEALAIARELGEQRLAAKALGGLAFARLRQGDLETALELAEAATASARRLGDRQPTGRYLIAIGLASVNLGRDPRPAYTEALEIFREVGDHRNVAAALTNLGAAALAVGDVRAARAYLDDGLRMRRVLGDRQGIAIASINLGFATHLDGDDPTANVIFRETYQSARDIRYQTGVAYALLGRALSTPRADPESAATLHGEADAVLSSIGERFEAFEAGLRSADHERLRGELGAERFAQVYQSGSDNAARETD